MSRGIIHRALLVPTMLAAAAAMTTAFASSLTPGNLVIDRVAGTTLDAASPITLQQFSLGAGGTSAMSVGGLTLLQLQNGSNLAISGEYGSASEGFLTQSVNSAYLTLIGYGVTATTFNNAPDTRALAISKVARLHQCQPPDGPGGILPTSAAGLTTTHIVPSASPNSLGGNNGSINLTAGLGNGVNNSGATASDPGQTNQIGKFVYLSPEQYFFASSTVLYVADSGQPKNGNANAAAEGEGGLQKWVLTSGVWTLDYDMVNGLNLVNNALANANTPSAPGSPGSLV